MNELILNFNENGTVTLVRDGEAVGELCIAFNASGIAVEARRFDEAETGPLVVTAP